MAMDHIMLDLETLGTKSYSVILSIGAVQFDLETGEIGEKFYRTIKVESSLKAGFNVDADVLIWWSEQNEIARKESLSGETTIWQAVLDFTDFMIYSYRDCDPLQNSPYYIWGNSVRFDVGLLKNAFDKMDRRIPWDIRRELDVRTLVFFAPEIKENYPKVGVEHNALDDCIRQVGYCSQIYNTLKR